MLDKNTIGVIQQWKWASEHPFLHTLIEISPHTAILLIAICILKLRLTFIKTKRK